MYCIGIRNGRRDSRPQLLDNTPRAQAKGASRQIHGTSESHPSRERKRVSDTKCDISLIKGVTVVVHRRCGVYCITINNYQRAGQDQNVMERKDF